MERDLIPSMTERSRTVHRANDTARQLAENITQLEHRRTRLYEQAGSLALMAAQIYGAADEPEADEASEDLASASLVLLAAVEQIETQIRRARRSLMEEELREAGGGPFFPPSAEPGA